MSEALELPPGEVSMWAMQVGLPDHFLDVSPRDLHELFPEPTLVHVRGEKEPPLLISLLLHGNEPAGLSAVQQFFRRHAAFLPRSILLFIGNVAAARAGVRRLKEQPDFNRIWMPGPTTEHGHAQGMLAYLTQRPPFLSVDIHNNTGRNPHYACVHECSAEILYLASQFERRALFSTAPPGMLTLAMTKLCPAVTLECGPPDDAAGAAHAARFLGEVIAWDAVPAVTPGPGFQEI